MLLCTGLFRLENTELVERTRIKHPMKESQGFFFFLVGGCRSHFETTIVQLFIYGKENTGVNTTKHARFLHVLFNLIKQYSIQTPDLKWVVWLIPPVSEVGVSPVSCAFKKHLVFSVKNVF